MSHIERTTLGQPFPLPREEAQHPACLEKAKEVALFILDCLIWVWYALEHAFNRLMRDSSAIHDVFEGRVIVQTHNYAKFSDLWSYVCLRRYPIPLPDGTERFVSRQGFVAGMQEVWTKPHCGGACMGGSVAFFRKWFQTQDIFQVAEHFKEGVPLEGVVYQEMYSTLFKDQFYPYLRDKLIERLENPGGTLELHPDFDSARVLFEGVDAYLAAGLNPAEGGMAQWVRDWVQTQHNKTIGGLFYGSLREAATHFDEQPNTALDRRLGLLKLARLEAEVLTSNRGPGDILRQVPELAPGAYQLFFPTYNSFGCQKSYHTVALVIPENGLCYICETNGCIAYIPREDLQATCGRLLQKYTGFDYAANLDGEHPDWIRELRNTFNEQANPPSDPLTQGFDLFRITQS